MRFTPEIRDRHEYVFAAHENENEREAMLDYAQTEQLARQELALEPDPFSDYLALHLRYRPRLLYEPQTLLTLASVMHEYSERTESDMADPFRCATSYDVRQREYRGAAAATISRQATAYYFERILRQGNPAERLYRRTLLGAMDVLAKTGITSDMGWRRKI